MQNKPNQIKVTGIDNSQAKNKTGINVKLVELARNNRYPTC